MCGSLRNGNDTNSSFTWWKQKLWESILQKCVQKDNVSVGTFTTQSWRSCTVMTPINTVTSLVQDTPSRPRSSLVTWILHKWGVQAILCMAIKKNKKLPSKNHSWPEVAVFAVLNQDVSACSLEVQHASIKGTIMRVSKSSAGGWSGKAMRTTQARSNGWLFILGIHTHTQDSGEAFIIGQPWTVDCVLYWLLHRLAGGSADFDSARLQTCTHSWCRHPPPTVRWSCTLFPGTNKTCRNLKHTEEPTLMPHALDANRLRLLAGWHTLALVAAFPGNLHLFLTIWTLYRWTLFNATLNVTQLRKKKVHIAVGALTFYFIIAHRQEPSGVKSCFLLYNVTLVYRLFIWLIIRLTWQVHVTQSSSLSVHLLPLATRLFWPSITQSVWDTRQQYSTHSNRPAPCPPLPTPGTQDTDMMGLPTFAHRAAWVRRGRLLI